MDLLKKLEALECPFNWNLKPLNKTTGYSSKERLIDKLKIRETISPENEESAHESTRAWDGSSACQIFSQMLTLSWIEYPETTRMRKILTDMENFIAEDKVPLIMRYKSALKYLIDSMWGHVYYDEGENQKVEDCLKSFDELEAKDKAAVMALKSCVYMEFGPVGKYISKLLFFRECTLCI